MLHAALILALAAAGGAQAQCVGESNGVTYDFCGQIGPVNVYWTPLETQTNILFEGSDDAWWSFGFGNAPSPDAMPLANHIFGCDNFDLDAVRAVAGIPDLMESPWDGEISGRDGPGVAGGFADNNLAIENSITETRMNGVCGIRFERMNILPDPTNEISPLQDLVNGTQSIIIVAGGDPAAIAQHTMQMQGVQDFLGNTGTLTDNPVVPLATTAPGATQPGATQPGATDDNSSAIASLSQVLIGVVASLTFALW